MATYTKRGNSYRLRASCGYTPEGKQVMKSKTWTPTPGMTPKQIEKELNRQMVLFDEECRGSSLTDGHIKFETFAGQWFKEYVEKALGKRTQANYRQLAPRIYQDIGHLYMDKITPRQIQKFINSLSEPGANQVHPDRALSPKSIKNHLSFISSVFAYAIKMGMLQYNPCRAVTLPPLETGKEKVCYTLEEAQASYVWRKPPSVRRRIGRSKPARSMKKTYTTRSASKPARLTAPKRILPGSCWKNGSPSVSTTGSASPRRFHFTTTPQKISCHTSKGKSSRKFPPRPFRNF